MAEAFGATSFSGRFVVLVVLEASRVKSEARALKCSTFESLTSDSSWVYHGTGFSVVESSGHPKLAMAGIVGRLIYLGNSLSAHLGALVSNVRETKKNPPSSHLGMELRSSPHNSSKLGGETGYK